MLNAKKSAQNIGSNVASNSASAFTSAGACTVSASGLSGVLICIALHVYTCLRLQFKLDHACTSQDVITMLCIVV